MVTLATTFISYIFLCLMKMRSVFYSTALCTVSLLVIYKPLIMRLEFWLPFLKYFMVQCQILSSAYWEICYKADNTGLSAMGQSNLIKLGCNNSIKFLAFDPKYHSSNRVGQYYTGPYFYVVWRPEFQASLPLPQRRWSPSLMRQTDTILSKGPGYANVALCYSGRSPGKRCWFGLHDRVAIVVVVT